MDTRTTTHDPARLNLPDPALVSLGAAPAGIKAVAR